MTMPVDHRFYADRARRPFQATAVMTGGVMMVLLPPAANDTTANALIEQIKANIQRRARAHAPSKS